MRLVRRALVPLGIICIILGIYAYVRSQPAHTERPVDLSAAQREWLERNPRVKLGPDTNYPPLDFFTQSGEYAGISADFLRSIQRKIGRNFIQPVRYASWDEVLAAFDRGELDMVSSIMATPARKEKMIFTDAYVTLSFVIIVRQTVETELTLDDLAGMKIAMVKEYASHEYLVDKYPGLRIDRVPDLLTGLKKVSFGIDDAMIMDISVATYLIEREGITNLKVAGETDVSVKLRFACRKDNPMLRNILQTGLAHIKNQERLAIQKKWVTLAQMPFYASKTFWAQLMVALIVIAVTGILIWNHTLKRVVREKTGMLQTELDNRIRAEKNLSASEERYRIVIEQTHHMVYDYYIGSGTIIWAGAIEEITGYTPEEYQAIHMHERENLLHPDDREEVLRLLREAIHSDTCFYVTYRMMCKDGTYIYVEDNGVFLKDEHGAIYRMLGTIQDITSRIRSEEEIRKFKTISDNANFGIAIVDNDGKILYVNEYFASVHGYTIDEVIDNMYTMFHNEKQMQSLKDARQEMMQQGGISGHEIYHVKKDGTEFPMLHHTVTIRDKQDTPIFSAVMAFDITKRKRAEEEVRKFKTISDNANYGVAIVDTNGYIMYTNKYYAAVHGYTIGDLMGKHFTILHNEEQMQQVLESSKMMLKQDHVSGHEIWHTRKDGSVFPMLHHSVVIRNDGNEPLFTAATAVDITERKKAEAEREKLFESLAQKNQELEEVNKELNNFNHVASHDLRNPITIIKSFAEMIEQHHHKEVSPKVIEYITRIKRSAVRMEELVSSLLTLSRLSRIQNPFEPVDVQQVVDSVLERLEYEINRTDANIIIKEPLPTVICDQIKMTEVFLNLIDNAIKYSSKNPDRNTDVRVEVGFSEKKDCFEFYITDNGVGIDPEYHDQIFESFTRLFTNDEYPGTGLGLSIVQKVIEDHGGRIWVESQEGKGATFFFTISKKLQKKNQQPENGTVSG